MQNSAYNFDIKAMSAKIEEESVVVKQLIQEINQVIVGQEKMISRLLVSLFTGGHVLLEGMPGLAKTLAIKTLSETTSAKFSRIQFTPDLLPSDVIGTLIFNAKTSDFEVKKGPIFANFVLADEINRAPAKVQSALLQAMQEKEVSIGDTTYNLDPPFLVLATQNPVEQEGTYPLPEAQLDRFLLKLSITYPTQEEEKLILRSNMKTSKPPIVPKLSPAEIAGMREKIDWVYMDEKIEQYILDLVFATREPEKYNLHDFKYLINYGASPRGTISLAMAAKANAFINGRPYVTPEDVRELVYDVLRHRIGLSYEAEAENMTQEDIISQIINNVEIP